MEAGSRAAMLLADGPSRGNEYELAPMRHRNRLETTARRRHPQRTEDSGQVRDSAQFRSV